MKPSERALGMAAEKITYKDEGGGEYIVTVFGQRFKYNDEFSAIQARERLQTLVAEALQDYAAEVQALNSWDALAVRGQA